ncbi:MAG: ABC transporter permease [Candidatus Woesearchaeota archaeon]
MNDVLRYVLNSINRRKMRSFLTSLSILVGIMAIFALVSFGVGVSGYLDEIFEDMGTDKMMIQVRTFGPPGTGSDTFTDDDVRFISRQQGVDIATGLSFSSASVRSPLEQRPAQVSVLGVETETRETELVKDLMTVDVIEGRWLRRDEEGSAVLGNNYLEANRVFERPLSLRDRITINGQEIQVVGFLDSLGNPEDDSMVILSDSYFDTIFDRGDEYNMIYIQAQPNTDISRIEDNLDESFREHLGQEEGEETFSILAFEDVMETSENILDMIIGLVVLIALISVVVAAINITNTMYTSVLERTKEIGIMKAIGAKNRTIKHIFLLEASILGFFGGLIGIGLGYGIASFGGYVAAEFGYSSLGPEFPLWLVIGCLIFSTLVGALAGLVPAVQASRQEAAESLRDE